MSIGNAPSSDAAELLAERLVRLETLLGSQGAPFIDTLLPGLPENEISGVLTAAGVSVLPELLVWFGWHNGSTSEEHQTGLLGWRLLSLGEAVALHDLVLETSTQPEPVFPWLLRTWFPLATSAHRYILVDVGGADGEHPIYVATGFEDLDDPEWPWSDADSMAEAVNHFLLTFEAGAYYWDAAARTWGGSGVAPPSVPENRYL